MSFPNASKYYVALAFYVSPESRDTWIHMKKSAIEKTMKTCGIQHLTILSDVKQGPHWTNEFFNSDYTSPNGKKYGQLDNYTDSFLFLLQEYNYSPTEIHQDIHNAIECFMNTFQKQLRVEDQEFMSHSAVVLYQVTGTSYREIVYTLPLSEDEEDEYQEDDEEDDEEDEYEEEDEYQNEYQDEDCSDEINRINFLTNKIDDLEKYISSIERERDYCNEAKTRIEDQHNAVLVRLDNLRSELNKFKSKDPEQLKKNIETLQRELEQIKKDEEKQRQQQEQERQRQQQEQEKQRQQEQEKQGKNKNRLLDPPPRERIKNKGDPFYVLDLPNPGSKPIDDTDKKNIKKQFRKLSLIYHPDKNKDNNATEDFQALNNAWETIKKLYGINGGGKRTKKNTKNKKTKRDKMNNKTYKNTKNTKTKRDKMNNKTKKMQ
jgi:DNA repair exonuclease SbcCD ATPase subunit